MTLVVSEKGCEWIRSTGGWGKFFSPSGDGEQVSRETNAVFDSDTTVITEITPLELPDTELKSEIHGGTLFFGVFYPTLYNSQTVTKARSQHFLQSTTVHKGKYKR